MSTLQVAAVANSQDPASAMVARVGELLAQDAFTIVDMKPRALLVDADGTKLMIGIQATK